MVGRLSNNLALLTRTRRPRPVTWRRLSGGRPDMVQTRANRRNWKSRRSSDSPCREISRDGRLEIPACALFDVSVGKQIINGRGVMMLKLGRIAVVSMAALTFAAATIPTKAEAADLFIPRGHGPVAYGGAGAGCGCQVWVPPPPP